MDRGKAVMPCAHEKKIAWVIKIEPKIPNDVSSYIEWCTACGAIRENLGYYISEWKIRTQCCTNTAKPSDGDLPLPPPPTKK